MVKCCCGDDSCRGSVRLEGNGCLGVTVWFTGSNGTERMLYLDEAGVLALISEARRAQRGLAVPEK